MQLRQASVIGRAWERVCLWVYICPLPLRERTRQCVNVPCWCVCGGGGGLFPPREAVSYRSVSGWMAGEGAGIIDGGSPPRGPCTWNDKNKNCVWMIPDDNQRNQGSWPALANASPSLPSSHFGLFLTQQRQATKENVKVQRYYLSFPCSGVYFLSFTYSAGTLCRRRSSCLGTAPFWLDLAFSSLLSSAPSSAFSSSGSNASRHSS